MRTCTKCRTAKPAAKFRRASGYADGRQRICVDCYVLMKKDWRKRGGYKKERSTLAAKARQLRWKRNRPKNHPDRIRDRERVRRWQQNKRAKP